MCEYNCNIHILNGNCYNINTYCNVPITFTTKQLEIWILNNFVRNIIKGKVGKSCLCYT